MAQVIKNNGSVAQEVTTTPSPPVDANYQKTNTESNITIISPKEDIRQVIYQDGNIPKSIFTLQDILYYPRNMGINILRNPLNVPRLQITEFQPAKLTDVGRQFLNLYMNLRETGTSLVTMAGMSLTNVIKHPIIALGSGGTLVPALAVMGALSNPYAYQAEKSELERLKELFGLPMENFKDIISKEVITTYELPYFGDNVIIKTDGNVGWSEASHDIKSGDVLAMFSQVMKHSVELAGDIGLAMATGGASVGSQIAIKGIEHGFGGIVDLNRANKGYSLFDDNISAVDKALSLKAWSEAVTLLTPINFPPIREWEYEKRRKGTPAPSFNVKLNLYNENFMDLSKNFNFLIRLIVGSMWLQVNDIMYSQNLYRVRYPGKFDHYYCTMNLRIKTKGSLRKLNNPELLYSMYDYTNLNKIVLSAINRDYNMEYFPDSYVLDITFQPLLPNNFNTHLNAVMNNNWYTYNMIQRILPGGGFR